MPRFSTICLNDSELEFTNKILSSDALAAQIITRIKRKIPTSVIRMADGERAFIAHSKGDEPESFMLDPNWLKRYGVIGADMKAVGRDLVEAGNSADYLACTISGLAWPNFDVYKHFPERQRFIDQFFPYFWEAKNRTGCILRAADVLVLHREHAKFVPMLSKKYGATITGLGLDSWKDHEKLIDRVKSSNAGTVLVSGGPSGKLFCVKLARETGKVVLDIGEAIGRAWVAGTDDTRGKPVK